MAPGPGCAMLFGVPTGASDELLVPPPPLRLSAPGPPRKLVTFGTALKEVAADAPG